MSVKFPDPKYNFSISNCQQCDLWKSRKQAEEGKGNSRSNIMFLGEAPGEEEDIQGFPFVGRAGKMLDNLLKACELTLDDVYITNTVMCRPARLELNKGQEILKNRAPELEEVEACKQFLIHKIIIMKPKLIIPLGKVAARWFFGALEVKRGVIYRWSLEEPVDFNDLSNELTYKRTYKVLPLFHPAALLYNPNNKVEMEKHLLENMQLIKDIKNGNCIARKG